MGVKWQRKILFLALASLLVSVAACSWATPPRPMPTPWSVAAPFRGIYAPDRSKQALIAGRAALKEDNLAAAELYFHQAVAQQRGKPAAHIALEFAMAARARGDLTMALTYARQAVAIAPAWANGWNEYAFILYKQRDYEVGRAAAQKAVALDRRQCWSWYILGQAYQQRGANDEALQAYRKVFLNGGKIAAAGLQAGRIYAAYHQYEDAIAAYQYGLTAAPNNVTLLWNISQAYEGAGWWHDALDTYRHYLAVAPTGPHAEAARLRLRLLSWRR